ncbi:MAG: hypothetical protein ACKN82_11100 [Pirellula sp.]
MSRLADEPWAPVAQGHPGAEVVRSVRVALRGTNDGNHRLAAKKVTMSSAVDRPLRCMVWFWLFVVLVLVFVLVPSWDCTMSARSMRRFNASLQCDGRRRIGITACGMSR